MEKGIRVGLLGLGTVGSGVVKIIENHQENLQHRIGCPVIIEKILIRDIDKQREIDIHKDKLTRNVQDILESPTIDVVIEVMGGVEQTREYIKTALQNGKHVVTANKDLMALYGSELLALAAKNQCDLFYEASVAGGIPILRSLVEGLASDRITKLMGIVNGTTNFMLTKMSQTGCSYEEVLKEAQELGFAESDPTSDVAGLDAARKMTILARLGFSMDVELNDVSVRGITRITEADFRCTKQLGYTMKLIGLAHRTDDKIDVSVAPTLLPNNHPLASVNNEFNAVYVFGEAIGETMFYGPGAGSMPTATAVVSDLVGVLRNLRLGHNGFHTVKPLYEKKLKSQEEIFVKHCLRIHVKDVVGAFSAITTLFAEYDMSFEKILQHPLKEKGYAEIVVVTHTAPMKNYLDVLNELKSLPVVHQIKSSFRVEGEKR